MNLVSQIFIIGLVTCKGVAGSRQGHDPIAPSADPPQALNQPCPFEGALLEPACAPPSEAAVGTAERCGGCPRRSPCDRTMGSLEGPSIVSTYFKDDFES